MCYKPITILIPIQQKHLEIVCDHNNICKEYGFIISRGGARVGPLDKLDSDYRGFPFIYVCL